MFSIEFIWVFNILSIVQIHVFQTYSLYGLLIHFLMILAEITSFTKFSLATFYFMIIAFVSYLRSLCLGPGHKNYLCVLLKALWLIFYTEIMWFIWS